MTLTLTSPGNTATRTSLKNKHVSCVQGSVVLPLGDHTRRFEAGELAVVTNENYNIAGDESLQKLLATDQVAVLRVTEDGKHFYFAANPANLRVIDI